MKLIGTDSELVMRGRRDANRRILTKNSAYPYVEQFILCDPQHGKLIAKLA